MVELSESDRRLVEHVTTSAVDAGKPIGVLLEIHVAGVRRAKAKLLALEGQRKAQERVVALRTACIEALRATGLPE